MLGRLKEITKLDVQKSGFKCFLNTLFERELFKYIWKNGIEIISSPFIQLLFV